MRAEGTFRAILALAAVAAAVAAAPRPPAQAPLSSPPPLALDARPVPLDSGQPARAAVGPLVYRGGLWLRSQDPRFGGLSDLRVSADRTRLLAVSDCGHGFIAGLDSHQ